MQTVLFLGRQNGGHSARQSWWKAWKLEKRIKSCAPSSGTAITECCVLACLTTVHEFYGLKASQMSKVRASSHEYPDVEEIKNL